MEKKDEQKKYKLNERKAEELDQLFIKYRNDFIRLTKAASKVLLNKDDWPKLDVIIQKNLELSAKYLDFINEMSGWASDSIDNDSDMEDENAERIILNLDNDIKNEEEMEKKKWKKDHCEHQ